MRSQPEGAELAMPVAVDADASPGAAGAIESEAPPQPSGDASVMLRADGSRRLVLRFLRDVEADDLEQAWEDGFASNAKAQVADLQDRIDRLKSWMDDMETGQHLTFTIRPGVGVEVDVNGTVTGSIPGDDFARAFLPIWLCEHPPNPELKSGLLLLGRSCD